MIRVVLSGGLGNQLFQYALGRHLSIKYNKRLLLDASLYGRQYKPRVASLRIFDLKATITDPPLSMYIRRLFGKQVWELFPKHTYSEEMASFNPSLLATPGVRTVKGYFQSEKYFSAVAAQIRADLTFRRLPFSAESTQMRDAILNSEAVSIHVRRGDYLLSAQFHVCTIDYYRNAIAFFKGRLHHPTFFVFSDDMPWCMDNLKGTEFVFCDLSQSRVEPANDMRLMSLCKHHIIANSTFSWWGAWLNADDNKIVASPSVWLNGQTADLVDDIIPEAWTKIVF